MILTGCVLLCCFVLQLALSDMKLLKIIGVCCVHDTTPCRTIIIIVPMCQMQYKSQKWEVDNAMHYSFTQFVRLPPCPYHMSHLTLSPSPYIDWQIIIENFHCVYHHHHHPFKAQNTQTHMHTTQWEHCHFH